jgi:hypothetical protein
MKKGLSIGASAFLILIAVWSFTYTMIRLKDAVDYVSDMKAEAQMYAVDITFMDEVGYYTTSCLPFLFYAIVIGYIGGKLLAVGMKKPSVAEIEVASEEPRYETEPSGIGIPEVGGGDSEVADDDTDEQ